MSSPAKARPLPFNWPWLLRTDARERCPRTTAGTPAKMLSGTIDKTPSSKLTRALLSRRGESELAAPAMGEGAHRGQACEGPSSGELHCGHSIIASCDLGDTSLRGDWLR